MKIVPLGDRVLVKTDEGEKVTDGGIVIPDSATEKPASGVVVAIGYGTYVDGELIPIAVQPRARVYYSKYGGSSVGDGCVLLREDDILAVIEE